MNKLQGRSKGETSSSPDDYLSFGSSLSAGLLRFDAREVSILGLTAMIKVFAQMRNLRRGHDTQGKLKKVNIDATSEGYANFMAPLRIVEIHDKVQEVLSKAKGIKEKDLTREQRDAKKLESILSSKILQPQSDMFLTPEWDEMVPFPTSMCPSLIIPLFFFVSKILDLQLGKSASMAMVKAITPILC